MALTVNQEPQAFTPVYNEMTIRIESDETAQTNFRFKVEVKLYESGVYGSPIYTGYFLPRPDSIEAIIDVHRILENYVRQTLIDDFVNSTYGSVSHNGIDFITYRVTITEQYGSPRADYAVENVDGNAWNSSLKYQDFISFDHTDFLPEFNVPEARFLTNAPLNQCIGSDESAQLFHFIGFDFVPVASLIEIKVYEEDGTLQKTFLADLNTDFPSSFLVGTRDLEATTFGSGTKPVFDGDSAYYTVQLLDALLDPCSELRTFTIKDVCETPMRLHFLNRLGGMDSFTFGLRHKKSVDVDRMEINRQGYLYSTAITNLQKENGLINANITARDTIQLNSNWLTDAEIVWLEELITSPEIFLEMDGEYHSVLITNYNQFEIKTQSQDGVFNLNLDLKFAYESYSQRA